MTTQKRPQNCGTSYCSCIECVMEPDYKSLWEQMCERYDELDKKLAQQEHLEPVAWIDDYNACKCPDNEARCFSDKVFRMMQKHTPQRKEPEQEPVADINVRPSPHGGLGIASVLSHKLPVGSWLLYTTPPPVAEPHKRKPLTDEEIMNIAKVSCIGISPHEDALNFAKVIEAVHGIKG